MGKRPLTRAMRSRHLLWWIQLTEERYETVYSRNPIINNQYQGRVLQVGSQFWMYVTNWTTFKVNLFI